MAGSLCSPISPVLRGGGGGGTEVSKNSSGEVEVLHLASRWPQKNNLTEQGKFHLPGQRKSLSSSPSKRLNENLSWAILAHISHISPHLILTRPLAVYQHCLHFRDEETEAPGGEMTFRRSLHTPWNVGRVKSTNKCLFNYLGSRLLSPLSHMLFYKLNT